MATRLFFILFLITSSTAFAQYQPAWFSARTDLTAATNSNAARQILAVKNSTVLWGRMTGTTTTQGGIPHGNYNIGLYDTTGNLLLQAPVSGTAVLMQAQADAAGNWYILGRYLSSITLPGPVSRSRSLNEPDHFIMRLSSNGLGLDWFAPIGGDNKCDVNAFAIRGTDIYLAMDSATQTVVQHINAGNGAITRLWIQKGTGNTSAIAVDDAANIYMAGSCVAVSSGLLFNGFAAPVPAGNNFPAYIVRYRAGGQYDWHYYLYDNACPVQRQLTLRDNNTVFFSGGLHDSLTLGNMSASQPANTTDYLVARLDSNGSVSWLRQTNPGSGGGSVRMDYNTNATLLPDGTLALFPQVDGTLYWNDSVLTLANSGPTATVIGMNSGTGRVMWNLYPNAAQQTIPQHIAAEGNGVYITGNAITQTGEVQFGPYAVTMPSGTYYPFLARIRLRDTVPAVVTPPQAVGSIALDRQISMAPVPATTSLHLGGLAALGAGRTVSVLDGTGKLIFKADLAGMHDFDLPVKNLPRGLYLIRLSGTAGMVHRKVAVQ